MAEDDFVYEFRYPIQSLKVAGIARAIGEDHAKGEDHEKAGKRGGGSSKRE